MREFVPWWGRIGAKLILSRIPAGYSLWRRLNLFAHGQMHRPEYALRIFREHFGRSGLRAGLPFVALELGPGDSLASALVTAAHGATRTYLVDAGDFATADPVVYREMARYLRMQGLMPPELEAGADRAGLLSVTRASYGTAGLESLRQIPSQSVDFIWSNAVLEHIRRADFTDFIAQTRRILRPGGSCSHQIDLRDHLGGALNNLRISSRCWERQWMANSGFYTNRLRKSQILQIFAASGFAAEVVATQRWDALPTARDAFAPEFKHFDAEDLLVSGFAVVLRVA